MTRPKREKIDCADLFSRTGARLLADVIVKYWRDRGYSVFAEAYPADGYWGVRSNLVNGLPMTHLALRS